MAEHFSEANKKEFVNALANNLPVLRAKLGISQQELAELIGISRNMLTYIEGRKKEMSWITFVALSLLFMKNVRTEPIFNSYSNFPKPTTNGTIVLMIGINLARSTALPP